LAQDEKPERAGEIALSPITVQTWLVLADEVIK
jgi:hypothetical protein